MKQTMSIFCLIVSFQVYGLSFNKTDIQRAAKVLTAQWFANTLLKDVDQFDEKFSVHIGVALHDPWVSLVGLAIETNSKGVSASSSSGTIMNRVIAQGLSEQYHIPESVGYLGAAAVDAALIFVIPPKGSSWIGFRNCLIEFKLVGALSNSVQQMFIEQGNSPDAASLTTAFVTAVAASNINHRVLKRALVIETGIRMLPSVWSLLQISDTARNWGTVLGSIPLIAYSRSMRLGLKKDFVSATGMAFLIGNVYKLMGTLL